MSQLTMIDDRELARCQKAHGDEPTGFGALQTEAGNLPLEAVEVRGQIAGLLAGVRLRQSFVNHLDRPLEATYIFPLPDRGALRRFELRVADREVQGVLREREAARQEYDRAIESGHRAAIVEEERPDVFTIRVGNIAPGERATVSLHLVVPLSFRDGEATFRFPLVVAPRYIPGAPLPSWAGSSAGDGTASDTDAVPDASRISPPVLLPGFPSPVRLSLALTVDAPAEAALRCSLHAVTVADREAGRRRVALQPGERLDRDFYLRYRLAEPGAVTSTGQLAADDGPPRNDLAEPSPEATNAPGGPYRQSARPWPGTEGVAGTGRPASWGTFALDLVPPLAAPGEAAPPRDVIFLLDRSGSMEGWKIVAARRAVARMIDTLTARDRFGLLAFDHAMEEPKLPGKGLAEATDRNRYRAVEFLAQLAARGGTEIAAPLITALEALARDGARDRQAIVVLVTDGQVGNERQVLGELGRRLGQTRVFCVGIDRAVNAGFLGRLAELGRGRSELVESEDRLDAVMAAIHRSIDAPVLTEVTLSLEGATLEPGSLLPAGPLALFAGAPLTLRGRIAGSPSGAVRARLSGQGSDGQPWSAVVALADKPGGDPEEREMLRAAWARAMVRHLEDRYDADPDTAARLERRIVEVSLAHRVLCRFTAFVAVDRAEKIDHAARSARVIQPVESPAGWGGAPAPACPAPVSMASGASFALLADSEPIEVLTAQPGRARVEKAEARASVASRIGSVAAKLFAPRRRAAPPAPPAPPRLEQTQAGVLKGKFAYFSPAALRGEPLGPVDDVFLLGLLIYELCTGERLFTGSSQIQILESIRDWDESRLDARREALGPLLPLLRRALAVEPASRPADAGALVGELVRLVDAQGWSAEAAVAELDGRLAGSGRTAGELLARSGGLLPQAAAYVGSALAAEVARRHACRDEAGKPLLLRELTPWDVTLEPGGRVSLAGAPGQRRGFWR